MLILAILGVLLPAAATASGTTLTPLTYEVSAVDPVVMYLPEGPRTPDSLGRNSTDDPPMGPKSVPPAEGWELSFSGVDLPLANVTFETLPTGTPKATTALVDARMVFEIVGTGVVLWGNCSNTTGLDISVGVNRVPTVGTNGLLANVTNLPYRLHQVTLDVKSGSVSFYSATVSTLLQTEGITADKVNVTTVSTLTGENKTLNPVFTASSGQGNRWEERWGWAGTVWDRVATDDQNATLTYSVPANTSFLALYGGTSGWNGDYEVEFTPEVFYDAPIALFPRRSQYSLWAVKDVLLWITPLDPGIKYNMTLKALLKTWSIDVSQVRTWSALAPAAESSGTGGANETDTAPDKKTENKGNSSNIGVIIGVVVCVIVSLVAILLLVFFMWWRKNKRKSSKPEQLDLLDDYTYEYHQHTENALLIPFPTSRASAVSDSSSMIANASPFTSTSSSGDSDDPAPPILATKTRSRRPCTHATHQETDAGVVVDVVPPSYNPQWAASGSSSRATA